MTRLRPPVRRWFVVVVGAVLSSGCGVILGIHTVPYDDEDATVSADGAVDGAHLSEAAADATRDGAKPDAAPDGARSDATTNGDTGRESFDGEADAIADSAREDSRVTAFPEAGGDGASGDGGVACNCVAGLSGWSGPVIFFHGSPLQASAACAPGYEMVVQAGKDGLKDGGASCSACVCDPSVLACGQTVVTTAMGATCASGPCTTTTLEPNGCVSVGDDESCASPDYLSATSPVMGQCVPTGGALDAGVSWTYSTLACGPADGGATCSNGACLPPTPVGGYTCIYSTTQTICPATFPNLFASYTGTTSTLSCSSCTCGSPGGCTTKVFGYSTPCMGQGDGGPIATPTPLGDCTPRGLILSIKETAPPLPPAAGCPAGGGDLSGSVVPDPQTLTTFCCE